MMIQIVMTLTVMTQVVVTQTVMMRRSAGRPGRRDC
ncbi:hypothetical protein FRAHR75_140032 [Frankia sp. Hr75.2]|nr:hypothetical protein FRAHR75_140032 [Frankia sp. Hr75.2]